MPKTRAAEGWLSVVDIADRLGLSPATVYRKIGNGEIGAHRFGRTYRVSHSDFDAYVEASRVTPDDAEAAG